MIIVGELINSTRKAVAQAIEQKDKPYLQDLAKRQAESGAAFIDINTAASGNEIENMKWVVELVQEVTDTPLCIDSPSAAALQTGLQLCRQKSLVNSITAEKERWEQVLPLVTEFKTGVIALCMEDGGMPESTEDRLRVAEKLVTGLTAAGVAETDIYLDPLIKPLGVNHKFGVEVLETTRLLRERYPEVHIISGLSNVSFGLPERRLINRAFMTMSVAMGMDAFILDPLDQVMMSFLAASRALAGQDEYCMDYIAGVRAGKVKA
ncbi:5-methyltetrahydrofolate:corrinoid/iron-sulfur protein co-methyltransferase [Peptococcaceae bacterium CEB3]|nr:5-methyltetrahydrofolate:corrinoid/iron-sulfur protein co-methyltransferase [Peptococcaceae bacterium CEB3]